MNPVKISKISYIVVSVLMVLAGIAVIIYPDMGLNAICYVVGALAILFGAAKIIGYYSKDLFRLAFQFDLALGILTGLLGVLILIHPEGVAKAVPVIIGVFTLADGAMKFQTARDARKFGFKRWWIISLLAAITCFCGLFLIINPFQGAQALMILLGVSLISDGVQNLCTVLYTVKTFKKKDKSDGVQIDDDTEFYQ